MAQTDQVLSGTKELAASNTATALTTSSCIKGILITAGSANAEAVKIGGAGVTSTSYALAAGASVSLDLTDPAKVFLYGKEHDTVTFLAVLIS